MLKNVVCFDIVLIFLFLDTMRKKDIILLYEDITITKNIDNQ